jgi:hypothetical protein
LKWAASELPPRMFANAKAVKSLYVDSTAYTIGGYYSTASIIAMLDNYLIQVKNKYEGDINTLDSYMILLLAQHMCKYFHPKLEPITSPIDAVRLMLEDDEYEVIMIKL